jgi:hypothetical protein
VLSRPLWMPARDAIAASMLYGLGLRPQELFGATFRQVSRGRFRVAQVLTKGIGPPGSAKPVGRIIAAAKTADGVRTMTMRAWVHEELREWRACLVGEGLPAGDDDFIIPGAAPDGHYALEQQHNFIRDIKACGRVAVARDPDISFLQKVMPYSLRRGHISLRVLAGEDIKRIADECGTSTAMIHRHYLHELDVRHELPDDFSFDGAVEAARRGAGSGRNSGAPAPARAAPALPIERTVGTAPPHPLRSEQGGRASFPSVSGSELGRRARSRVGRPSKAVPLAGSLRDWPGNPEESAAMPLLLSEDDEHPRPTAGALRPLLTATEALAGASETGVGHVMSARQSLLAGGRGLHWAAHGPAVRIASRRLARLSRWPKSHRDLYQSSMGDSRALALAASAIRICRSFALLAQLVEHFHGKEGVIGSSPIEGFRQVQVDREVCASMVVASAGERVQGASTSQTARRSWAQ